MRAIVQSLEARQKRDFDLSAIEAEFVVLDNNRGIGSGRELARERRRDGSKGGGFKKSYPTAGCFLQSADKAAARTVKSTLRSEIPSFSIA